MTAHLTPDALQAIRARADAATEGPWAVTVANVFRLIAPEAAHENRPIGKTPPYPWLVIADCVDGRAADMTFIAAARTDIPNLLAVVDAQVAVLKKVRELCESEYRQHMGHQWVTTQQVLEALGEQP